MKKSFSYDSFLEKIRNNKYTNGAKWFGFSMLVNLALIAPAWGNCNTDSWVDKPPAHVDKKIPQISGESLGELKRCAKSGHLVSQASLGRLYRFGISIDQDFYEAYQWYLKAAKKGHSEAQYQVGIMLFDGIGVTEDAFEALDWLFLASLSGHQKANEVFDYILEHPELFDC